MLVDLLVQLGANSTDLRIVATQISFGVENWMNMQTGILGPP